MKKLTETQKQTILTQFHGEKTAKELAKEFGVKPAKVYALVRRFKMKAKQVTPQTKTPKTDTPKTKSLADRIMQLNISTEHKVRLLEQA